jgi:SAM-dependent methyltransferase
MQTSEAKLATAWDESYARNENYLFLPTDQTVTFFARYLRRRVGQDEVIDMRPGAAGSRMIDVGCGIGRYLLYGTDLGMEMHGVDRSINAVEKARQLLANRIGEVANERVAQSDIRKLPWGDRFFAHALSEGVLDSMPYETAKAGVGEIARVTEPGGYFFCTLISGDETGRDAEFRDEVIVQNQHEKDTIQSYFNYEKVVDLLEPRMDIVDCTLIQMHNRTKNTHKGRWHVVCRVRGA